MASAKQSATRFMSSLQQAEREVPVPPPALPAALTRLLTAYTMVLWIEFQVSAASSRAISQIAVFAILQTIALPTELPRRDPHFTRKLVRESKPRASNGVANHLRDQANGLGTFTLILAETITHRRLLCRPKLFVVQTMSTHAFVERSSRPLVRSPNPPCGLHAGPPMDDDLSSV